MRSLMALRALKPPTPDSVMAASEPPVTMASAKPKRMLLKAAISASFDEAQAEVVT